MKVELYEDANKMFYGFLMSRGSSKFSIYTRTKHVFDVWKAYFQYYTVQEDFDRQYSIIDMYEKERGAMYAQCLRVSKKYDKLKTDKICYMAKFIEANTLLEDSESV